MIGQRGDKNLSVSGSGGPGSVYQQQQPKSKNHRLAMVANEGTSRRRIVKYMPLKDNRRARQNQVKQSSHFVDSDFFDSQSVQRVTQPPSFPHRMRSTSPVSSRASTMLRQQSLRTRKSQMESPPPKGSGQVVTTQTSNKPSLREDSDMSKYEKMMMLKRKQKAYSIER